MGIVDKAEDKAQPSERPHRSPWREAERPPRIEARTRRWQPPPRTAGAGSQWEGLGRAVA